MAVISRTLQEAILDLKISQEVEIILGRAVTVSYFSSLFNAAVPPGPGSDVRNMLGWSLVEKTVRSGASWFRGALKGKNVFFFHCCSGRLGQERIVPHTVVGPLAFFVFLLIFVWARPSCRAAYW